jgi:hypothetical protein
LVGALWLLAALCLATAGWLLNLEFHLGGSTPFATAQIGASATSAAFLTGTAGWLVTNAVNLRAQRLSKASDLIRAAQDDDKLIRAMAAVGVFGRANEAAYGQDAPAEAADGLRRAYLSAAADRLRSDFRTTLNFFEEMAIFIRRGAADETLLRDFYVGTFYRLYQVYAPLRPALRNIPRAGPGPRGGRQMPELYANVDWLYGRWRRWYSDAYFYGQDPQRHALTGDPARDAR